MGLLSRQLLKVIEYVNDRHDTIIYKFPMNDRAEIMTGSSLTVREGQVAIFMKDGRIADIFAPGRYKLATANLPVLTSIMNWHRGFNSPFKCDVYFVETTQFAGQKWGTTNPFTMRDKDFGVIRVRSYGKYSFKVTDAKMFMQQISGSKREYTTTAISEHLRGVILSELTDILADSKFSAIDLSSKLVQFNEIAMKSLQDNFEAIGLTLSAFVIENISFPEEVEKAIDKRGAVGIMGDVIGTHVAMEQAAALRDAANNQGSVGTMVGMGMFGGVGGGMAAGMIGANSAMNQAKDAKPAGGLGNKKFCPHCGGSMKAAAKFCPDCGKKVTDESSCPNCQAPVKPGAKFCGECGTKL